jgi:protease I
MGIIFLTVEICLKAFLKKYNYGTIFSLHMIKNQYMQQKVAVLVANGFEQSEFEEPIKALITANMILDVISLESGKVRGWKNKEWGQEFDVNKTVDQVTSSDYDALLLPGGVMNPDQLRNDEKAVRFVKGFCLENKPIAAICHGPWTLIEAEYVKGKNLTSFPAIKSDLINAGANWKDEEVVVDGKLVTSRSPKDLPAFCSQMIETIEKEHTNR